MATPYTSDAQRKFVETHGKQPSKAGDDKGARKRKLLARALRTQQKRDEP